MSLRVHAQQLEFVFKTWGGRRKGAGRKRHTGERRGVPHAARPEQDARVPLQVTIKTVLRNLRRQATYGAIQRTIRRVNALRGDTFRVVAFSVQADHIHLIIEADTKRDLANGMRALNGRSARSVNGILGRKGALIRERYHALPLTCPRLVRRALVYVLGNFRKHGSIEGRLGLPIDPYSSASDFEGYSDLGPTWRFSGSLNRSTAEPRTWLLARGWRKHGLISIWETPSHTRNPGATPHTATEVPPNRKQCGAA